MSHYFEIRVEFLSGAFHGRGDENTPEWPPSPLRLFQALVAASAANWNERERIETAAESLKWLEAQKAPEIFATRCRNAEPYRLYVPNNAMDLAANLWVKGKDNTKLLKNKPEKDVSPVVPVNRDGGKLVVFYRWEISEQSASNADCFETLKEAAAAIPHLGWGIDHVVADGRTTTETELLKSDLQRWNSIEGISDCQLRIPVPGTFDALEVRHQRFVSRLNDDFVPVPPLTTSRVASYRNESEPFEKETVTFALRPLEGTANFRAFDTARESTCVAAMVRHLLVDPKFHERIGWTEGEAAFLHGHANSKNTSSEHEHFDGTRVVILPLPSLEFRGEKRGVNVGSVRRVMLTLSGAEKDERLSEVAAYLSGSELIPENNSNPDAILAPISRDNTTNRYTAKSSIWATVTPVVLPGFDDPRRLRKKLGKQGGEKLSAEERNEVVKKLAKRTEKLLRITILHAGFPDVLVENAELEWNATGYWPGNTHVRNYFVPKHLQRYPRYHVRIRWRDESGNKILVKGPVCLGGGRFTGAGLFAPLQE